MANPFDAVGKEMFGRYPQGWLALGGLPAPAGPGSIQPGNVDLSGFSAAADAMLLVNGGRGGVSYTAHLELQTGPDPDLDDRVLLYHVLGRRKYRRPVASVLFLLRPVAQNRVTGRVLEKLFPDCSLDFRYRVIRVWELPVERLLAGNVGTLPLAPVAAVADPRRELPGIYRRVWQRLEKEVPEQADDLWGMTYIMSGVRHPRQLTHALMKGVHNMRESVTYQGILAEGEAIGIVKGKAQGLREALLRLARIKLGPPDAAARSALEAITDVARLEAIVDRVGTASTWQELLAKPPRKKRRP